MIRQVHIPLCDNLAYTIAMTAAATNRSNQFETIDNCHCHCVIVSFLESSSLSLPDLR